MKSYHIQALLPRLIHDFQFKEQNGYLRQGVCPNCKKKELFTSIEMPFVLRCGRENKCGAELIVKEIYPDIFDDWSAHYPKTQQAPNAAADAYLQHGRGLDIAPLKGLYSESSYHANGLGAATVKFALPEGAYWERIIDRPSRFDRKANFFGSYKGHWWTLPQQDLTQAKEIWLTEGIFDALSLIQNGIAAVSLMTCHNYPEVALNALKAALGNNKKPLLVWALDNGAAGERAMKKFVARSHDDGWKATAARPAEKECGNDWNDLHMKGKLTERDIARYRYYGKLLLASTAFEKARLMFNWTERSEFDFQHDNRLYWFKLDIDKMMKTIERIHDAEPDLDEDEARQKAVKESGTVVEIANCYPTPLYFQKSVETDESWYYMRVDFPRQPQVKATFTASQLTSASEFKKRLLHVAKGAVYTGTTLQLDRICKQALPDIKEVITQNYVGYNKEYGVYVFNDVAVQDGKCFTLNEEDYFSLNKLDIKTLSLSPSLAINTDFSEFDTSWLSSLWDAFGAKGYVVLAFWLGSFFAEQIRKTHKSYPFLEICGEPGSGKSTLIEFLWRLCGRADYEGFDASKSSVAARGRNFSQISNLPVCLIESDRVQDNAKLKAFDWEELKSLYNGRATRSLGVKNSGNETYEPLFKGSIVIAQNAEINASRAVLERIIHLYTDKAEQSVETRYAAIALERYPIEKLSGFLPTVLMKEAAILKQYNERVDGLQAQLFADKAINHERIAKNHAQLIALLETLALVLPVKAAHIRQTRDFIIELAKQRVQAIQLDQPQVMEFWELFDYLHDNEAFGVNHSSEKGVYAVNFNHIAQVASEYRQSMLLNTDIKNLLKAGRMRKFVGVKTVRSVVNSQFNSTLAVGSTLSKPDVLRCWVFQENSES
ncbi:toprim domain-containing protein [Providencia rettgeri]|uniref:toprim domain-containing protein n=1 Tax=Providencia rettgeri TaxID=587 RepID=UPI00155E8783|nr:toprim domain-containing protein [Providencia rettgeri]MCL0013337.1 toprim domain-containing protein [Providencia rettgeri]QKG45201.1 toprim domain-containing protein [Providencia rettgeri]QNN31437.1 toprim domain-containing protein [Providencia rettgeri]UEK57821.1 toprim domain-containing protein [Providencia rettgeri]